jgi:hypothetical protein
VSDPTQEATPEQLARAVQRLVDRVSHWTPERWAASGAAPRMHALVQRVADLAATAEGGPSRQVPRLDSDLALPDQLKVVTVDLLAAQPTAPVFADALTAVREYDK